jgi:hypothetical protein
VLNAAAAAAVLLLPLLLLLLLLHALLTSGHSFCYMSIHIIHVYITIESATLCHAGLYAAIACLVSSAQACRCLLSTHAADLPATKANHSFAAHTSTAVYACS